MCVTKYGHLSILQLLMESGAEVDAQDKVTTYTQSSGGGGGEPSRNYSPLPPSPLEPPLFCHPHPIKKTSSYATAILQAMHIFNSSA